MSAALVRSRYTWLSALAVAFALTAACGERVSKEEFDAAQHDLRAALSQVDSLETANQQLQTKLEDFSFGKLAVVFSINAIVDFPPTVVDLTAKEASVQMISTVPTMCVIAHGHTSAYGQISTDESMTPGGHTDHLHVLRDLEPNSVHHYKWGLVGPDGAVYASEDLTFRTPPANSP